MYFSFYITIQFHVLLQMSQESQLLLFCKSNISFCFQDGRLVGWKGDEEKLTHAHTGGEREREIERERGPLS